MKRFDRTVSLTLPYLERASRKRFGRNTFPSHDKPHLPYLPVIRSCRLTCAKCLRPLDNPGDRVEHTCGSTRRVAGLISIKRDRAPTARMGCTAAQNMKDGTITGS
jgi:hypothetical protein